MLERRAFIVTAGAAGLLAACGGGPPGPAAVTLAVSGAPGMNPGPDGSDRPLALTVLRLRDTGAFTAADYFALQEDPAAALGADLIGMQQIAVTPGGTVTKLISFEPEATQIGVMAALRDPAGKVWRATAPIAAGQPATATVTLGPAGLALAVT